MSSERSGSNLLRVLLGNHSNLASPVATQLMAGFSQASRYYLPLNNKENAQALFNEILAAVNHDYQSWKLQPDFNAFYQPDRNYCFFDFFDYFYALKASEEKGKDRIVFKENATFDFAFQLLHYYKDVKFLYLYRDPRDYVTSWMNVPLGYETPEIAVNTWVTEQMKCDTLVNVFGLPAHYVKYEDLIADPAGIMTGILHFIGEPVEEACFSTDAKKNEGVAWNMYWKNLAKPIMNDNKGNFRTFFDEETIRMIEFRSREYMIKLGYDPAYDFKIGSSKSLADKIKRKISKPKNYKIKPEAGSTEKLLKERQDITRQIRINAMAYFEKRNKKN